jgi:hypothetical protein
VPKSWARGWLAAGLLLAFLTTATLALLGVWLWARRRGRGAPAAAPKADAAPVAFACPGCGHGLKVKAELAGKKGKCPKCGHVLLVPRPGGADQKSLPAR